MGKKEVEQSVLKLLKSSPKPLSTRDISQKLDIAWHTADRYCLKLFAKKKIDCFTIGTSTAWYIIKK